MIYAKTKTANEKDFLILLENTKILILQDNESDIPSPGSFEHVVFSKSLLAAQGTVFEDKIVQTGTYSFPDIVANRYFGIEVKMTISDKWSSTGNSVLESTRVPDVNNIYLFFGKFGGQKDIKYRKYEECLNDIGVTHSPRYKIDMNLEKGASIFDKMGISYDQLRSLDNPIKPVKKYYREQLHDGEELWWIDEDSDRTATPIISPFNSLPPNLREKIIFECMLLFPEVFGNSGLKFERPAIYLITEYNLVCSNLRDLFTAGGKKDVCIKDKKYTIPQIAYKLFKNAGKFNQVFNDITAEKLAYYWDVNSSECDISFWENHLGKIKFQDISYLDLFKSGLNKFNLDS